MASKDITININGKNNASNSFKSAADDINKLKTGASDSGKTIGDSINKGSTTAAAGMNKLKSQASTTFGSIRAGASAASQSLGDLGSVITSIAGGIGAMEIAQAMWTGATQKQFNSAYLQTKMSKQAADDYIKTIQQIVAEVPGDDTFMNNLMTGAVAKNTTLTNVELKKLGNLAADYLVTSQSMGKSQLETQMDLKEYILTGNTSQLERDSILKNQMNTLKDTKSVQERILALDEAMKAEGYEGLSQLDIASIKWEEIKGKLQLAATTIGEKILPYVEKVMDWLLKLDESTNGWSTTLGVAAAAVVLLGVALAPILGTTLTAYYAMKNYRIEAEKAAAANALNKGPAGAAGKGGAGGVLATAAPLAAVAVVAAGIWTGFQAAMSDPVKAQTSVDGMLNAFNQAFGQKGAELLGLDAGSELGKSFAQGWSVAFGVQFQTDLWNTITWIQGAWGNTVAYITGAWNNTVNSVVGAYNYMKSIVGGWIDTGINVATGALSWAQSLYLQAKGTISNWINTGINVATGAIDTARSAWNDLKNYIMNHPIVGTVRQVIGMGPGGPKGPSGPSGLSYNYENYAGSRHNAWQSDSCLSGNCYDMTAGLIGRYGGSMVWGTWNGNSHVWWKQPNGSEFDPARMALNGTGTPPPRGPGGDQIIIPVSIGGNKVAEFIVDTVTKQVIDAGRF